MAILLIEGFDTYNGTGGATATTVGMGVRWTVSNLTLSSSVTPFGSGQSVFVNAISSLNDEKATIGLGTTITQGTVGFAAYFTGLPSGTLELVVLYLGGTTMGNRQLSLFYTGTGNLAVGYGTSYSPTAIYTTPGTVRSGAWNYIELEFTISNTTGSVNIYVNGALIGSASGLDTQGQTSPGATAFGFGPADGTPGYGASFYIDNIYLTDTPSRLGEQRVVTVVPTSDSTPSQWSASGGAVAPYTMVDEVLCNGDTDYIFDGTVGDRAVFNMASTGLTPVTVSAVQIGTFTRKTDSGARSIQLQYVDGGGTGYNSSDIPLGSTYQRQLSVLETNPATSAAWTPSEANALKVGVRISA